MSGHRGATRMPVRVLSIAYALTPVSTDACGGTEQIAARLLALHRRPPYVKRLRLTTVAATPSRLPGRVIRTNPGYWAAGAPAAADAAQARLARWHDAAALAELRRGGYDLVHIQGAAFYGHAAEISLPCLLTLHLPLAFYPPGVFAAPPPNLWLQAVSRTQCDTLRRQLPPPARPRLLGHIANGIDLGRYRPGGAVGDYWLYLGRMCPEKAPHLAIALARRLRRRLVLAGAVYPFPAHQQYFRQYVAPHLGGDVIWLPALAEAEKIACLRGAAAVVIPSQAEETSSLVAMEAAACGRPVLAWSSGALPELVRQSVTGWVGDSLEALAARALWLAQIRPAGCRQHAERHFDARRMAQQYCALYEQLARTADSLRA
ncbi:MAG: glycosyltransferase [Terriglobales bacterium]